MASTTKPTLYNGFKIKDDICTAKFLERVLFTEAYLLTNNKYLYLFLDLKEEDICDHKRYELFHLRVNDQAYLGLVHHEHSMQSLTHILNSLKELKGFSSVAGMVKLKELLTHEVINPLKDPEKYKQFKISIPNGILLYGPPGCGKTFIVKKLAEEIGYYFVELNPSAVASQYIHGAVPNIAKAFDEAKKNSPAIVFIDEIDGLLPKRANLGGHADTKKEEINEFLTQLNDSGKNNVLVVGATNRPGEIDSAILRSGRMDKRIFVSPPDWDARKEMLEIYLMGRPYDKGIDFGKLADMTEFYVSSDIELIINQAARATVMSNKDLIDEDAICESIQKITPSISRNEISKYEQYQDLERW